MPSRRSLVLAAVLATVSPAVADDAERLLVGLRLDNREVGTLEVIRDSGGMVLPIRRFAELSGIQLEARAGSLRFATPLGPVDIPVDRVRLRGGDRYLADDVLGSLLSAELFFDDEEFAVVVDLPWGSGAARRGVAAPLVPDVAAPGNGLSTLRADIGFYRDRSIDQTDGEIELTGKLADGFWRLGYRDDFDGNSHLDSYSWLRPVGRTLIQVGRQNVQLHPLTRSLELTGAQIAWTNRPRELFRRREAERALLPRRLGSRDSFIGPAPAGSTALLLVDGVTVDRRTVGLDGRYRFEQVELPGRRATRVEIQIFERHNPATPIAVHGVRRTASDFLLEPGTFVQLAGAGHAGDLLRSWDGRDQRDGLAGFYGFRGGLTSNLTVEAALQSSGEGDQATIGFVGRPAPAWITALAVGAANGEPALSVDLEGYPGRWAIRALSHRPAPGFEDDGAETWFRATDRLDLGLVARSRRDPAGRTRFARPALRWRPGGRAYVRAQPDVAGRYDVFATFRPGKRDRVTLAVGDVSSFDYRTPIGHRYRLGAGIGLDEGEQARLSVTVGTARWTVGTVSRGSRFGALAALAMPVAPGMVARLDYESLPLTSGVPGDDTGRLRVGLAVDLSFAGGRPVPAGAIDLHSRGSIGGMVRVEGSRDAAGRSFEGLGIWIDGRVRARTGPGGRFLVGGLEPGVYVVELDPAGLPVELVVRSSTRVVEVAEGMTTGVEFPLDLAYGIAGRTEGADGGPAPGTLVELADSRGRVVRRARSDRWGLYRLDGLPPGSYRLRAPEWPGASRELRIADRFLFEQNLRERP